MSRLALCRALRVLAALLCAPPAFAASLDAQVRDAAGQPVSDAVVYASPASGPTGARPARRHAVQQADREFVPYVSVIQTGTAVEFPNRDPILHHVYSFSPAKPFEIKLYHGKAPREIVFDKPGVITLGCNIHDWMVGYILVVSTAHFAKTDAAGHASLRDLGPGRYELRAWHPHQRTTPEPAQVTLDAASAPHIAFVVDAAARKAKFKPPLDRLRY
jgi:plastocyanin